MAGIELQKYATVHEMSNQQSEKQRFPNTNLDRLGKTGRYLQLRSFTFFALHDLYSEPFLTLLAGGCPKVVILTQLPFAVEMWAQMGQITNTAWKNTCGTLAVRLQQWHNQQSVKARSSPTPTWIALGKLVATYNFAASPFLHYMISTQNHF